MVALDKTGSSATFGRGTGRLVGVGSEGSPGVLGFFLARGFLVTFAVEGGGSVTGEGGRAASVDGGSYTRAFHELMFLQTE